VPAAIGQHFKIDVYFGASSQIMILASEPKTKAPWSSAFAQRIQEFPLTPLNVIAGAIPQNLRGSLYRNGPGLFERQGEQIAHWFDGDGAILAVHFDGATANGTYRMVQTEGYLQEEALGKFQLGGYGRRSTQPFWKSSPPKNAANTSVIAAGDRLLALWEGGLPHALDRQTLETSGLDNLQGLTTNQPFSAHPKVDPKTSEIYNFGVTFGRQTQLNIYRCDRSGKLQQQGKVPLDYIPIIHDFVLAGPYLIFCISPVHLNPLPVMLRQKSYSDSLVWHPERGTRILVVDRETLTPLSQGDADPWFQWHFGNGYVDPDGQIVIDVVRYEDFQTNRFLQEVPGGKPQTNAPSQLWRMRIDAQKAHVTEFQSLSDHHCEFPIVNPFQVGQAHRYTYMAAQSNLSKSTDLFDAIGCYDHEQDEMTLTDLGDCHYLSEPIFAPDPQNPYQGWILVVVYNVDLRRSEVWILDSQHLDTEPLCRLALPQTVALGFHGTWSAA
jgi:all-trans-8'-apo-beta-carotenal 15,15'-oxygenase